MRSRFCTPGRHANAILFHGRRQSRRACHTAAERSLSAAARPILGNVDFVVSEAGGMQSIVHLDRARAQELVTGAERAAVIDGRGQLAFDRSDPLLAATHGRLTLTPPTGPDASRTAIGRYQTSLRLPGVRRLPLSIARELARHRGHLFIDDVASITDAVADALACHEGGCLSLAGLRSLSAAAAAALGRHGGDLFLNGVQTLRTSAARGLAHHRGRLSLDGLARLSSGAAAALALHGGDLTLDGLLVLPPRVARHLARYRGAMHFHGLTALSDGAAEALGGRQGHLCLKNVRHLSPRQAQGLASHTGELHLYEVAVTDDVAEALGRHEGALLIHVPDDLPHHRLEALLRHRGPLELSGIASLDDRRARALAAQPFWRGIEGLSYLGLGRVNRLTPAAAAILATHRAGGLALNGLRTLTADVARELVRHPLLALDCVERVSDEVAAILATHAGASLALRGITQIGAAALARLKDNPGIELSRRFYE